MGCKRLKVDDNWSEYLVLAASSKAFTAISIENLAETPLSWTTPLTSIESEFDFPFVKANERSFCSTFRGMGASKARSGIQRLGGCHSYLDIVSMF